MPSDEPPSLLVMPFPVASDSKLPAFLPPFSADSRILGRGKEKEVLPKWEGLGRGMMERGCPVRVGLDEWDWLVRGTPEEEAEGTSPNSGPRVLIERRTYHDRKNSAPARHSAGADATPGVCHSRF